MSNLISVSKSSLVLLTCAEFEEKGRTKMKRKISEREADKEIVWQTPANPPQPNDFIFLNGIAHKTLTLTLTLYYLFSFIRKSVSLFFLLMAGTRLCRKALREALSLRVHLPCKWTTPHPFQKP